MSEKLAADLDEVASIVLGQQALFVSLLRTLQRRGLLDQVDLNEVIDHALTGIENSQHVRPETLSMSRRQLEEMAVTMGGDCLT